MINKRGGKKKKKARRQEHNIHQNTHTHSLPFSVSLTKSSKFSLFLLLAATTKFFLYAPPPRRSPPPSPPRVSSLFACPLHFSLSWILFLFSVASPCAAGSAASLISLRPPALPLPSPHLHPIHIAHIICRSQI